MKMYHPLVSIVMPVYNGANYMRQAIDSALAQTYDNIEIILVNDGSTDNGETERIALSYGDKIRYFKKENGGCASALNYGISKMNGEWFSWLSHDDLYAPDKIRNQIDAIIQNDLNTERTILRCETHVIDENGDSVPHMASTLSGWIEAKEMTSRLLGEIALNGCALLIPKKALDEIGPFSTEYTYILDMIYWVNLSVAGYDFFFTKDASSLNRKHVEQVSVKKHNLLIAETKRFSAEIASRLQDDPDRAISAWVYCHIKSCKEGCRLIEAKHKIPMKARIKAWKIILKRKGKLLLKKILQMR